MASPVVWIRQLSGACLDLFQSECMLSMRAYMLGCTCMHTCLGVHACIHAWVYMRAYMLGCTCMCVDACGCVHECWCMHACSVCSRIVGQPGTRVPGATISTGS